MSPFLMQTLRYVNSDCFNRVLILINGSHGTGSATPNAPIKVKRSLH